VSVYFLIEISIKNKDI